MTGIFNPEDVLRLAGEGKLTFEKAIELFETVYMASRNLSERTRAEYKTDVEQLAAFLTAHGDITPAEVSLAHLQAFLAKLDAKGLSGVTRRRKTASIRALFGFLTASRLIPHNPTRQLIPPAREYKEPRYLTSGEYQALLRACSHEPRDAALIELMLQTGIRLSEVARLTVPDIELPARINRVLPIRGASLFVAKAVRNALYHSTTKPVARSKPGCLFGQRLIAQPCLSPNFESRWGHAPLKKS